MWKQVTYGEYALAIKEADSFLHVGGGIYWYKGQESLARGSSDGYYVWKEILQLGD